ncbi:hypothetical protein D1115_08005 [Vibrio alfacsensis]|uniref:Uncharacterized protein n=1 Tax=Vibrio alfacsensis TaxID=1074311 RepID=A0ABM6YX25_9VIBR|nr:hypothetical protein [Vibrio alfacsensis]AXY02349.1 hypothetical protein D1115_08005 [Vibrio alfacsensis]
MFGMFKKKEVIQSIAQEVPKVLLRSFGDKHYYLPVEIDQVLAALNYKKENDLMRYKYAYGMFSNLENYEQLGLTDELGNYGHFQREVGKMLLNTPEPIDMHIYFAIAQKHHMTVS